MHNQQTVEVLLDLLMEYRSLANGLENTKEWQVTEYANLKEKHLELLSENQDLRLRIVDLEKSRDDLQDRLKELK